MKRLIWDEGYDEDESISRKSKEISFATNVEYGYRSRITILFCNQLVPYKHGQPSICIASCPKCS